MRTEWLLVPVLLLACGKDKDPDGKPIKVSDVVATVSADMGTTVTVTWSTSEKASSWISFDHGTLVRETAPDDGGTTHTATLVALPQATDVSFRVVVDGEEDDGHSVTTGSLAGPIPQLTVTGSGHDHFTVLPLVTDGTTQLVVLDPTGQVVWHHEDTRDVAVYRARVAADGSGIVYAATVFRGEPNENSALIRVPWEGGAEVVTDIPWLAHDFIEHADGTIVSLAYEYRKQTQGNKLIAVDPDGTVTDLWSAWDCMDPATHPSSDPDHGWIHSNALDYDEATDSYLVGMRNQSAILQVDAATGACGWTFGGQNSDFDVGGQRFLHQHQFSYTGDKMLVFDNAGAPGLESRVIEYDLNEGAMTASTARTLQHDPKIFSLILGDAYRFSGGDTQIIWSVAGLLERVDPQDGRSFTIQAEDGVIMAFAEIWYDPGRTDLGNDAL